MLRMVLEQKKTTCNCCPYPLRIVSCVVAKKSPCHHPFCGVALQQNKKNINVFQHVVVIVLLFPLWIALHKKNCLCCCPLCGAALKQNKKYRWHALIRRRHHCPPVCFVSCGAAQKRNIHVIILFAELRCSRTKNNDNALQRIIVVILLFKLWVVLQGKNKNDGMGVSSSFWWSCGVTKKTMKTRFNVSLLLSSSSRYELFAIKKMTTREHCHPLCKAAL